MALTKDTPRLFQGAPSLPEIKLPMVDADIIYDGAALSDQGGAGYLGPLTAGEDFIGWAMEHVENTGADGAKKVTVRQEGLVRLTIAGTLAETDKGTTIYASDDGTFTKTAGSNSAIGKLWSVISTTEGLVMSQGVWARSL